MAPPCSCVAIEPSRRLVCPEHGRLDPSCVERCPTCDRRPYDLDDEGERTLLRHLRKVAKSQRKNMARALAFVPAIGGSLALFAVFTGGFGLSWIHAFVIIGGVVALTPPLERALGWASPRDWREVDRELLPG